MKTASKALSIVGVALLCFALTASVVQAVSVTLCWGGGGWGGWGWHDGHHGGDEGGDGWTPPDPPGGGPGID